VKNVAYKVKLSPIMKYHPIFYVNMLKRCHEDTEDSDRGKSSRAPTRIHMEFDKETEEIIADSTFHEANNHKWMRLSDSESSWEPTRALWQFENGEGSTMRASLR